MDQIAKDILELVENHQKPVSVHQIMMEYHRNTDKHLYMQVDYFGYKSVAQFLAVLEQLELEMSPQNMLEVKVRGRHMPKSSSDDIAVRIEAPKIPECVMNNAVIRSYTTVKEESPVVNKVSVNGNHIVSKKTKKRKRGNALYQRQDQTSSAVHYPDGYSQRQYQGRAENKKQTFEVWNRQYYPQNNNWFFDYNNWYTGNQSSRSSYWYNNNGWNMYSYQPYGFNHTQRSTWSYWTAGTQQNRRRYF